MKEKLNNILLTWGLYPMLKSLKHFEEKEEYEKCALIKNVIYERFKDNSYSLSEENINKTIEYLKLKIPNTIKNMWYYEQECLKELNETLTIL